MIVDVTSCPGAAAQAALGMAIVSAAAITRIRRNRWRFTVIDLALSWTSSKLSLSAPLACSAFEAT
jgi:hypothetical protein